MFPISSKLQDGVSSGADILRHLLTSYPVRKLRGIDGVARLSVHSVQHHSLRDGADGAELVFFPVDSARQSSQAGPGAKLCG